MDVTAVRSYLELVAWGLLAGFTVGAVQYAIRRFEGR